MIMIEYRAIMSFRLTKKNNVRFIFNWTKQR